MLADSIRQLDGHGSVVSIACNHQLGRVYLLSEDGKLSFCDNSEGDLRCYRQQTLLFDDLHEKWMQIDYVAAIASIVCISEQGSIATIAESEEQAAAAAEPEQIGMIDNGISAASWSPDYSCLLMVTNNDSLLCMSVIWDVLYEVPTPKRSPSTPSKVSWKGDGEMVAIQSTDDDSVSRVRIYNSSLELLAVNRNVADGEASTMKGVGHAMAFASNGSYVAVHQERIAGRHQVSPLSLQPADLMTLTL